jgi:hypothetical protein
VVDEQSLAAIVTGFQERTTQQGTGAVIPAQLTVSSPTSSARITVLRGLGLRGPWWWPPGPRCRGGPPRSGLRPSRHYRQPSLFPCFPRQVRASLLVRQEPDSAEAPSSAEKVTVASSAIRRAGIVDGVFAKGGGSLPEKGGVFSEAGVIPKGGAHRDGEPPLIFTLRKVDLSGDKTPSEAAACCRGQRGTSHRPSRPSFTVQQFR